MKTIPDLIEQAKNVSTPLIAISTADPQATQDAIAKRLANFPLLSWDIARGVIAVNELGKKAAAALGKDPSELTTPGEVLIIAAKLPGDTVLFFHMAHQYLENEQVKQAVWNLRDIFKANGRTLIGFGPSFTLPTELAQDVLLLDEPLPTEAELSAIVTAQYENARQTNDPPLTKETFADPDEKELSRIVDACRGLAAYPSEQAVAMALRKTGIDLDDLWIRKKTFINQIRALRVEESALTFADVGGLETMKAYLGSLAAGPLSPIVWLWIDEIEKLFAGAGSLGDSSGVSQDQLATFLTLFQLYGWTGTLAVGHPGTGKSLVAKTAAKTYSGVCVAFDTGAAKGSLVGESEKYIRAAFKAVQAIGGNRVHVIATCLEKNTLVTVADGSFVTIEEAASKNVALTSVNLKTGQIFAEKPSAFRERSVSGGLTIRLSRAEIDCTIDHPYYRYSPNGLEKVRADQLRPGDFIPSPLGSFEGNRPMDQEMAYLVGYTAGDGNVGRDRIQWAEERLEQAQRVAELCSQLFGKRAKIHRRSTAKGYLVYLDSAETCRALRSEFPEISASGSTEKACPLRIMQADNTAVAAFLSGLFDADGTSAGGHAAMATVSRKLAHQVVLLLTRLNINASLYRRKKIPNDAWQINISVTESSRFADVVRFQIVDKQMRLLGQQRDASGYTLRCVPIADWHTKTISRERLALPRWHRRDPLQMRRFLWQRVKQIVPYLREMIVYDLTMPTQHNFIANGIIVHNCNGLDSLKPEMRRRFGTPWVFDLPTKAERDTIWPISLKRFNLDQEQGKPDDEGWTGAEINKCCELAYMLQKPLSEAACYVIPIVKSDPEAIKKLRDQASNRWLSASYPGPYRPETEKAATGGRKIQL